MSTPERLLSRESESCRCGAPMVRVYLRTTTMRDYHVRSGCSVCCAEMRDELALAQQAQEIGQERDAALCSYAGVVA